MKENFGIDNPSLFGWECRPNNVFCSYANSGPHTLKTELKRW